MKKIETVIKNIKKDKDLLKKLEKALDLNFYANLNEYIEKVFIYDALRYVRALRKNRVIYIYNSVTQKKILESTRDGYLNFNYMFYFLNFSTENLQTVRCTDVFNFNYNLIRKFNELGLVTKKECSILQQKINFCY